MRPTWLKVLTASRVASGSLYEVTEGYDSPPQQVKTLFQSHSE